MTDRNMTTALAALGERGIATSPTGLILPDSLSYEQYERIGGILGWFRDATAWWIGDWLVFGSRARFADRLEQAALSVGRSPRMLTSYMNVAMYVHPSRRRTGLSWSHHRLVAYLSPAEQTKWLKRAEAKRWTVGELGEQLKPRSGLVTGAEDDAHRHLGFGPCVECGGQVVAATECLGCGRIEREEIDDGTT